MNQQSSVTIKNFKSKLSSLKRSRRFVSWGESRALAGDLLELLDGLRDTAVEPRTGTELVAAFYRLDRNIFERCDDSSGYVGEVFYFEAKDLFLSYASRCEDKQWLQKLLLKLNSENDYGVRDPLLDSASSYLPEEYIRKLIVNFQILTEHEEKKYERDRYYSCIESLARQVKDAALFEQTRVAAWGTLNSAAFIDIARVYLESGEEQTALERLEQIPLHETFKADDRDRLLFEVHSRLCNKEEQTEAAWRIFRRCRNLHTLGTLLEALGDVQRDEVIEQETEVILADDQLSHTDAAFLVDVEQFDAAQTYLLERVSQLNGDYYQNLLPLAEAMETEGRALAATILYRALLDSILRRARTKTYYYGARYLKKLDRFARRISDWSGFDDHDVYSEYLQQKHGRKKSFWAKYGT